MSMAGGGGGSQAFTPVAVFIMLEAVSDASHIKTDVEDSAGHDGQVLDGERTDAIQDQKGVVKIKSVVRKLHLLKSRAETLYHYGVERRLI